MRPAADLGLSLRLGSYDEVDARRQPADVIRAGPHTSRRRPVPVDLMRCGAAVDSGIEIRHCRVNRMTLAPDKCNGRPCIRGLRMPVTSILSYLAFPLMRYFREWPELE